MKKVFISQLMDELSLEQIKKDINDIIIQVKDKIWLDFEVIDSMVNDEPSADVRNKSVWCLSQAIEHLAQADLAVFSPDWEKSRVLSL